MENENEETQKSPESDGTSNPKDLVPTSRDLEAIKAQLEEEKKAKAAAEASLAEKDALVADLQAQLSEVLTLSETKGKELEAAAAELTQLKDARIKAVSKYLEAARALNPTIPQDVIAGSTIEEIDAAVEKAKSIANAVKANLEAQAREAKVPAGAPARSELPLEGLSPREKIAAGIQQKQGGM